MRKVLAIAGSAAMMLAMATPALAASISNIFDSSAATVNNDRALVMLGANLNGAFLTNDSAAVANSGGNAVASVDDQSGTTVHTGGALTGVLVDNAANFNETTATVESSGGSSDTINNVADESAATINNDDFILDGFFNGNLVTNLNVATAVSNSGDNAVASGDSLHNTSVATGPVGGFTGTVNSYNFNLKSITRTIR